MNRQRSSFKINFLSQRLSCARPLCYAPPCVPRPAARFRMSPADAPRAVLFFPFSPGLTRAKAASREKEERTVGSGGQLDQPFLTRSSSLPKRQLGQAFQTAGPSPRRGL
ncbi:hypothetical protein MTO96_003816 [Rhipicephalus appendiculatus]